MPGKGSCVCGEWTYEYEGEPATVAVCHCIPCRKTAGSTGSFNLMIPAGNFKKLTGDDFHYTRKADSGNDVHYRNCAKCATIMFATTDGLAGMHVVKGGTVDSFEEDAKHKPMVEIFRKNAPAWCAPCAGAQQKEAS